MLKYLPIGLAIALMISAGYVQGVWSERWGTFPELKTFSDQLSSIPKQIGEWQGTDADATDEKILKIAGAEGEMVRTYKQRQRRRGAGLDDLRPLAGHFLSHARPLLSGGRLRHAG